MAVKEQLYLGVDLGTSFIKAGVYSLNSQCLVSWSQPVADERPAPGVFIQRGEMLYDAVCACIQKTTELLAERAADICAVAFTGQMAGAMAVDEDWNDVTTWSCTLDSRYLPYAERQRKEYGEDLFAIAATNAPVMCSKYAWFQNEFPAEHKRIAKYVMLNGYMIGRMAKIPVEDALIDYSLITWTGMADIRKREWSKKICDELGIDMRHLPKIVACTTVGGYLHADVAKQLGLPSGIPLVVGAGDKVSGCTGAAILNDGDMIFEAASYGAISCKVTDIRLDMEKRNYDVIGALDDQSYYAHKYIQGSGIATDWMVNQFFRDEGETAKQAFARAERLAGEVPEGSENMMAIGLLGGSAMPFDSEVKGLFMGHTWNHHRGHFYHALLESFSYDLALTLNSIVARYPDCGDRPIKLIGGGASSSIWPQMLADVTGHAFQRLNREDAALWGAAILAAAGTGAVSDIAALATEHVRMDKVFIPEETKTARYRRYVELYEELRRDLTVSYHKLNQL